MRKIATNPCWGTDKYIEVPKGLSIGFRKPTSRELKSAYSKFQKVEDLRKQIKALRNMLDKIEKNCSHKMFYDSTGFCFNTRRCAVCGESLSLV